MTEPMVKYVDSFGYMSRSESIRLIVEEHRLIEGMSLKSLIKYYSSKKE